MKLQTRLIMKPTLFTSLVADKRSGDDDIPCTNVHIPTVFKGKKIDDENFTHFRYGNVPRSGSKKCVSNK